MATNISTDDIATTKIMATTTPEPDLVDRMRRMSVGSTGSSYSLVSEVSTVQSLDTNGSVNGGVLVSPPTLETLETCLEALTAADRALNIVENLRDSIDTTGPKNAKAKPQQQPDTPSTDDASLASISPYWLQFPGFVPTPTATFKDELARLAKHENWSNKTKRKQQVKALSAEIAHHYGTNKNKLDRWQQLCEDVGIDVIPTSITQCRKTVSPVLVNLYNVIDHRRNPDVKILRFKSYGEFCRYTRAGHAFPRECAKQDRLIRVLLKKV